MESRISWLHRLNHLPWLLGALVAYYLPWVSHRAAAFTLNAIDLAEWISLHPTVRGANIPLVAPFLLRATFGGLALLFGLRALRSPISWIRWGYAILALLLTATLLPPPDFFRGALDDPNYRQQAYIAAGTFVLLALLAVAWNRPLWQPLQKRLELIIALLMLVFAIVGEILARNVMLSRRINVPLGIGIVAFVACLGIWIVLKGRGEARPA
jgi:hypothetical protein